MSKESNAYIITFAVIMIVVIAATLGFAKEFLKESQTQAVNLDTQKQILSAIVPLSEVGETGEQVNAYYAKHIESIAVDVNGDEKKVNEDGEQIIPEKVSIRKEFKKKDKAEKILPVFKFKDDAGKVTAYILPVYGNGLWDNIWGYIALEPDMKTVKGAVFDHKGETPGLGARIADDDIESRYAGKTIYNDKGELGIEMIKGEGNVEPGSLEGYKVDGMSGATITGRGVNDMLKNYFTLYENYMQKVKKSAYNASSLKEVALVK
ncbi:NADH:ubiquinone reductase (Na(+)-transporting) subunit C [Bernardetia sp. Wsw4-3y2]|uniref:NADH:ubiquinone reductase (Na(+)-transporting) subunit C n=1 Tax=Bernardetia sp. Wsw4-3y2 TaxID=3127471 RepID=UPI0030CF8CB7